MVFTSKMKEFQIEFIFDLYFRRAFLQLGAGLSVGLSGLAAGFAVGIVGDAGVRGTAQQPRLVLVFLLLFAFSSLEKETKNEIRRRIKSVD